MNIDKNDIPLAYVLKQERDKLQTKLNMLVPYTKRLEEKCRVQQKEIEKLRKEKGGLMREVTMTPIYKELMKKHCKLKQDNRDLLSKLSIYLSNENKNISV